MGFSGEHPLNHERGTEMVIGGSCARGSSKMSRGTGWDSAKSSDNLRGCNDSLLRLRGDGAEAQNKKSLLFLHQSTGINRATEMTEMMQPVFCAVSNALGILGKAPKTLAQVLQEVNSQGGATVQKLPSFHLLEALCGI